MNVKKMFASLTGVLMLAQAAAPMVTGAATYSDELQGAYDYAYSKGITTMTSIDNANMYGELTRGQLSKMISQWAEKEMWVKADETASCSFSDASTAEGDLATWVVKACQMGLMGQGINAFRPNDKVTRGEFGTVLSRAIWGDKYNQENPFYAKHLQALKDAGIMTKIEEPNSLEIRGWVMLMLQRAAETVSGDDECNDPAVLLACALGSTGCPAKCTDEAQKAKEDGKNPYEGVQAGDLSVAVSTSTSTVSIPNSGVIKVAELAVKASENIQLQSVDITRLGLSKNDGLKVWIEKDGRRITTASSFFGDSKANLTFNNNGYVVNWNETLDLVVSLADNYAAGSELQFKVSNLVSSAKSSSVSPDTTGLFRTSDYKTTSIEFQSMGSTDPVRNYNLANDSSFSFGEFKLLNKSSTSDEKDVLIKSITFKVAGSVENLANFKLLRDGKEVSNKATVDGKSVTFAVNDKIDSGKTATYKIMATPTVIENPVDWNAGWDSYKFTIKNAQDVIAEEIGDNATAYRVSVDGLGYVKLWTTWIKWGNITLTRDSSLASTVSAYWGYSDVVIAKGTIKVNQAVKFEKWLNVTWTNLSGAAIRRASLIIDGRTYQSKDVYSTGLVFESEIYLAKGDHNLELQISLESDGNAPTGVNELAFEPIAAANFHDWSYQNGDETEFKNNQIAGNIKVATVKIQKQMMTIKKSGPAEDVKISQGNTDEKVVLVWEISNGSDKTLEVTKFNFKPEAKNGTLAANLWDLYVVLGDATSSTVAIGSSDTTKWVDVDSVTTTVDAGKSIKFEVRLIPHADLKNTDADFRLVTTIGGKYEGNDTESAPLNSAYVIINEGATTTVVANTTDNKLIIKPGVDTKIASFNYNVKNDSKDITTMQFAISGLAYTGIDDLTIDFGGSVGAPWLTFTGDANFLYVRFNNVVTLPEANYKVNVSARFNESIITEWLQTKKEFVAVAFNPKGTWYEAGTGIATANHSTIDYDGAATMAFGHYIAKAYPILSVKDKNTSNDNERLDIRILKSNDDSNTVKITGLSGNPEKIYTGADTNSGKWYVAEWSETNLLDISLDANSATVIRASKVKWAQLTAVSFSVKDDDGKEAKYENVNAGSDFASLSL